MGLINSVLRLISPINSKPCAICQNQVPFSDAISFDDNKWCHPECFPDSHPDCDAPPETEQVQVRNRYRIIIFGNKNEDISFVMNTLSGCESAVTSKTTLKTDQTNYTIESGPHLSESDQENFKSNSKTIKKLFQSNHATILLFIIHLGVDRKIDVESIITFTILNDVYQFDSQSFLFILNDSSLNRSDQNRIQNRNKITNNLEILLDIQDIKVCFLNTEENDYRQRLIQFIQNCKPSNHLKSKEFSWKHQHMKELKNELEQKQKFSKEINQLAILLKKANVKAEESEGLLVFSHKNIQYYYNDKKNILTCSNNQGIKLLHKKELNILKYLLRRDALFNESNQIKEKLEEGILDKAILHFLKQQNQHIPDNNDNMKRKRLDEIEEMILTLGDDFNQNIDEKKIQLQNDLRQFEQKLEEIRILEKEIQERKERIRNLSKNVAYVNKVMQENDENLDDLLQLKKFQFESIFDSYEIETSKKIKRNQHEITVFWDRFDIDKEQKDVCELEERLKDEKNALQQLEQTLKERVKEQKKLETRNDYLNNTIPVIEKNIADFKLQTDVLKRQIETLKEEIVKLQKQKLDEIRQKRTEKIFSNVGGSDVKVHHTDGKTYRPHCDCVNFQNEGYTCNYIYAVGEAIDFVSDKLDKEISIDIEATKIELFSELKRFKHSVSEEKKHIEDIGKVINEVVQKKEWLRKEAEKIEKQYDGKINRKRVEIESKEKSKNNMDLSIEQEKGNLANIKEERMNNQSKIFDVKQAIKHIESGIKQKKEIIRIIEEKKNICNTRLRFSEESNKIKQEKNINKKITFYQDLLKNVKQSDHCSKFLQYQYKRKIAELKEYLNCLNDKNKDERFKSETDHRRHANTTQDYFNVGNKSERLHTTVSSLEDNQQQVKRLEKELVELNRKKRQAEQDLQEGKIIHKLEVTKIQLNYLESLPEIKAILDQSILLNESSQINSRTHYGFHFRGKRYAFQLPDPENNQVQQEKIKNINRMLELVDLIDKQIIELEAERQSLTEQLSISSEKANMIHFKTIERYLLSRFIRLSGFDRFNNGEMLNETESFISVLISEIINRPHLYQIDTINHLDPFIEQGLHKILKILKNNRDIDRIISEINQEYSDEGCISKIVVLSSAEEKEYRNETSHIEVHKKKELFLLKQGTLYFILKHDQTIKLIDDENLNLKLNINKSLSDLSNETDILEDLCQKRIKYFYEQDLQISNKLTQVYLDEINQLGQIHSIKEFNAEFSSYTNSTLFYFLSNLDENLDRLELKPNRIDFDIEETLNFTLIKIKDLYKTAIIKVLCREQERRKQTRLEKIKENENEEIRLLNLIQQDEEREKQLLEELERKQEEIFKIEADLNKIIDQLNQSEKTYMKQIKSLTKEKTDILTDLDNLNKKLNELSKDMINNEKEIREIRHKVEELNIDLGNVNKKIGTIQKKLKETRDQKLKLVEEKISLETKKDQIVREKKEQEEKLRKKQDEINQNQAWMKFLQNLSEGLLSEKISKNKQSILSQINSITNLSILYNTLKNNSDLRGFLFKDLHEKDVEDYIKNSAFLSRDEKSNLHNRLKQLIKNFLSPPHGELVSELGLDINANPIQIKKYKISASGNVSYREIHQNIKDTVEREIKCRIGGLGFDGQYLRVKQGGINSFEDLPKEIKPLIDDRIKINYQQHEWENRLKRKYEKAVEQLNELNIDYKQIVNCYVDQIEIICAGSFLLDSSDYYPGTDLTIRAKRMKCGYERKPVKLITTGSNALEFRFKKASDGSTRRRDKNTPEGQSGYDGELGRDGQHAGNIFIKIDEIIECLDLLESIELSGGNGGSGQSGGDGDKGRKGEDGKNGNADDTRWFGGGQTTFAFGHAGTRSGDGGDAGSSGRGGRAGQTGKLSIFDSQGNLFERVKGRVQQKEGSLGADPDLSNNTTPRGGEGGDPSIIGMDQVKNKGSFINKTTTENGEIDFQFLVEKNPKFREEIEKHVNFGNRGVDGKLVALHAIQTSGVIIPFVLLNDGQISYRMNKNEEQYQTNPRRDKDLKGKSKENERSRFREEIQKESQIIQRDLTNISNLDQSLLDKYNEISENLAEKHYDQIVNKLKIEKQDLDNKVEEYRSQEHSLEIDINMKTQDIETIEAQINQYQNELTELRQQNLRLTEEESLKIGQEIELMSRQQDLRDERNETELSQKISLANLQEYSKLHHHYQEEYDKMKEFLDKYKTDKQNHLKKKQEEKAEIENELAKLKTNLRENRKKLSHFKDENLKLLKEETILTEDILQKTQQEEQHEHEYEISCLLDKDIHIPRIRKIYLNKIEKHVFTPFFRKFHQQLTNHDENNKEFSFFQLCNQINQHLKENDKSVEEIICWLIKFDIEKIHFPNITEALHDFSNTPIRENQLPRIDQFNPYFILVESLKTMVNIFKNIFQTNLIDLKFDLNQIERFYRGIHYSYKIEIEQINENINNMKIVNDNLKNSELNKLFIYFSKEMEMISIEKFLDFLFDEKDRNNFLKNFKLILNYLNNKNEEMLFSYLDKNFLKQLLDLRQKLGDFNNTLLNNIVNGLKNIEEKRFLEETNMSDDVERMITIFDSRRLFRLECSSIDFHHNNSLLTLLESDMLQFNENPSFEKLISLIQIFQSTIESKGNYFYARSVKNDRKFFEVIIHNFDYFAKDTLDSALLNQFKNVIEMFSNEQSPLSDISKVLLIKIENKNCLNQLIEDLKQKNLSQKHYHNIVNELLLFYVDLDETKKESIKELINQIEDNNIQLIYRKLCLLRNPEELQIKNDQPYKTNQSDAEEIERNEDMKFIKEMTNSIQQALNRNVTLEKNSLFSVEKAIETTLLQVFYELHETYNDKSLRDEVKENFKNQVRFVLKQDELDKSPEKVYFMFQILCKQSYFYSDQLKDDDLNVTNEIYQLEAKDEERPIKNFLFNLDYYYHNLHYDFENDKKSERFKYEEKFKKRFEKLKEIIKILLNQTEENFLDKIKQKCLLQYYDLKDILFRLRIEKDLTEKNIFNQIKFYLNDENQQEDDQWNRIEMILSEIIINHPDYILEDDKSLEKFFGNLSEEDFKLFKCLLNSFDFRQLSNSFQLIRKLKDILDKNKRSKSFQEILLSKYFQICQANTLFVTSSLNNLTKKLDKLESLEYAVQQVFNVLNNQFGIETNKVEFYCELRELIDEVQLHYERQLQFPNTFKDEHDRIHIKNYSFDDIQNITEEKIKRITRVQFTYKGTEKLSDFSDVHRSLTNNFKEKKAWLEYLFFVHESTTTDQVLEKIKVEYVRKIQDLRKNISDEQLQVFLDKYVTNHDSDKQVEVLNLITNIKDDQLISEFLYHLQTSIRFEFKNILPLSAAITRLKSLNRLDQLDDIITILEENEYTLVFNLLEPLYKRALNEQKSNKLILSNIQNAIIHKYGIDLHVSDKKLQELQKKQIQLYLEKFDQILVENKKDGDLFYQYRIKEFENLFNEIQDKDNEQIEKTLALHLNQQIFVKFEGVNCLLNETIVDSIRLINISNTRNSKKFCSIKNLDYFFDKNGRLLVKTVKELNDYSVQVILDNQEKIYDFSLNNSDQFDGKCQMLNDLYASYRKEIFLKMIKKFNRDFNERNFLSNLIEITKQLTYFFRPNLEKELFQLETTTQIETITQFLKEFYSIIVDAMFPSKEDQIIISDFIFALSYFLEENIEKLSYQSSQDRNLILLKEEIQRLKICLKNKIYKESNYSFVEKEYEDFIRQRQQNPILLSLNSTLPLLEKILYSINTFGQDNKLKFLREFQLILDDNIPKESIRQLTLNNMKNIEKFLKFREELFTFVSSNNDSSAIQIKLTDIRNIIDIKESFEINVKNLQILEMKLNEHFDQLQCFQIKTLFVSLNKINLNDVHQTRETIELHLNNIKSLLIDFYLLKLNIEIKNKCQSKENRIKDDSSINKLVRYAQNLWHKLFQSFNDRIDYGELFTCFDKIYDRIGNDEFEYNQVEKILNNTVDKIITNAFQEVNENNLSDITSILDVLSFDYLYDKKDFFRNLLGITEPNNNEQIKEKYLTNLFKYCCLFCSLDENEKETLIRFLLHETNEIDVALKCLNEIIENTWDIRLTCDESNTIRNKKEIVIVKVDENFYIRYPKDNQIKSVSVDDKQDEDVLSCLDFNRNVIPRELFNKISKLVFEMIQSKEGDILINSNQNRIVEYIKYSLNKIDLPPFDTVHHLNNTQELEKFIRLLGSDEEKQQIDWILTFTIEKDDNTILQRLDKIFLKPVLSWLEELNALKVELIKSKIFNKFVTDEERKNEEILNKFEDIIRISQFFAENHLDDWFEIMRVISIGSQNDISLNDLIKIISLFSDFQDLSIVKQIITKTKIKSWLFDILFARIEYNLTKILSENLHFELINKLSHLKGNLRLYFDPQCLFLDIFGQLLLEYENQESEMSGYNLSRFLIEFIDLIVKSRADLDHELMNKLHLKSLPLWKLPLEKKILSNQLGRIPLFKHGTEIDKSITVDYLYKIGEEKGKDILTNLLTLIENIRIEDDKLVLNQLNELLEELTFGGLTLDKDSLNQLKDKSFNQWENILKEHTESQFSELNVEQLIESMKEKIDEGKINNPIKHLLQGEFGQTKINKLLENIYSFYGEKLNEKEKVLKYAEKKSKICTSLSSRSIKDWRKDDIQQWADKIREEKRSSQEYFDWDKEYLPEMMAVITRAVELYHGYHPRHIQLIALAIFLEPHHSQKGRLGNISTGEGKSLITAMLAAAYALIGRKVDIVTSSKVLAIRDASDDPEEGYKNFFHLFGLRVNNNCDDACDNPTTGQTVRKERYQQNEIIYGETAYFQRDILLTKFFAKNIREQIADTLLVDEVDNMVIDNAEKTLYISHGITDMRHLRDLFIHIWVSVNNRIEQSYSEENVDKIYKYIQLMIENQDLKIPTTLKQFVNKNLKTWIVNAYCAKYIENNDNYIIGDVESNKQGEILIMDKDTGVEQLSTRWSNGLHQFLQLKHCGQLNDESLKAVFMSNMNYFKLYNNINGMTGTIGGQEERELLSLEYGVNCFELPRFTKYRFQYEKSKEFICGSEHEWCEQIIADINEKMDAKRQVTQKEKSEIGKIKHESEILLDKVMAELKKLIEELDIRKSEKDRLSKEKDIHIKKNENLIDNIQQKLKEGDENESKKIYEKLEECGKDINIIRKNIEKINQHINSLEEAIRFHQIQQIKLEKNIQNYQQILRSSDNRDKRRAVLIICENIANLEQIAAKIRQVLQGKNNNIYTYDRAYRKFEKNELNPGDIIVATNIAGRGTDLTIDKLLEANGGLHVILSYVPGNLRVQQQVFGRTARGGKRGTGVYIVHDIRKTTFMPDMTVDFLLNERDEKEKERLQEIVRKSFPKLKIENTLFEKFNLFKEEIKSKIQESFPTFAPSNEQFISKIPQTLFQKDSEFEFNRNYLEFQLNSLQNHWAFWLNEMDEKLTQVHATGPEPILEKFYEFRTRILNELSSNTFGLIIEPGELIKLSKLFRDSKKYEKARNCYSQIIEQHPDFSDIAHYYKAFCIIHLEEGDREGKIKAKTHLKKALSLLESKRSTIMSRNQIMHSLNQITQQKGQGLNVNYFKKQNEGEAQILSHHINAILEAIGKEIGPENFRSGKITGDIPSDIYKELLKDDYDIIKHNRISKKIIVGSKVLITSSDDKWRRFLDNMTEDKRSKAKKIEPLLLSKGNLLTYENFRPLDFSENQYRALRNELQNLEILSSPELYKAFSHTKGDPQYLIFPNVFKYCQDEILNDLESVLIQSQKQNWNYKTRIIKEDFFEDRVFHREIFLNATQDIVKQREMIKINDNFKDELVGKLDDPVFCSFGSDIKNILLGKELILLSIGDRINRDIFLKTICQKMNMNETEYQLIKTLLNEIFEETIEIVAHVSETLTQNIAEKLKNTDFDEKIAQIQKVIQQSLYGYNKFSLSPGDIIQKTTLINTLKKFKHDQQMSEEQILNVLTYLEFNESLRIYGDLEKKFDDNTNDQVFCGKKEKIKEFLLGKESYTLISGEIVSIQPGETKISKIQLIEVMKKIAITDEEKIDDLFKHLGLEFYSLKFISSYKEFYLENSDINIIKEYLSKISFTLLREENKEEIKAKIKMLNFIEIGSLNKKSTLIKKTLFEAIEHNKSNLTREDFCLNLEEFELLRAILQDNGILESLLYEILSKFHNKSSSDSNKLFYSNLENVLITLYNNDSRISEENLSLRTANEVSKELWCRLRELTVIKEARVYFKVTADPDKRIENIRKQVENVVVKVFSLERKDNTIHTTADWAGFGDLSTSKNKEFDEYMDSITNTLKHVAGVLRTLPKVNINEKNLKTMFQTGKIPPELMDYVWMCFDSVLSLKEDKSFWDWDAFFCAMIGIAQIVAGIALDVLTCGAAHYFAQVLIAEGIGDIVFAIQTGLQGNFSWKAYCQHKVQSLMISLLTAGVGSYLGKGAQAGKMGIGLATKTAIFKAIGKETMTQLITGVTSAMVSITTDQLSQFIMNEIVDNHFIKIFDQWLASDAIYKAKKMKLTERFESIYKKFGADDASNIINDTIHEALLDLKKGELANVIFNRVTQIAHGISGAFSTAARTFKKGSSKAALFGSIAKVLDTTMSGAKFYKSLLELCIVCHRFCDLLDKKLSENFNNRKVKATIEKIKEENTNISISANVSDHIQSMENQMKIAVKEKVKNDFLKPAVQFTLNHAVKPIREFITSPFANAMDELKDHIDKRADEYMELIEKNGHEAFSQLTTRKKRALEQLGHLIGVKNLDPAILSESVSNFNGQSIEELIKQYGDDVKIAVRNGKLFAIPPTYKQYMDKIEAGIFAGPIHFKLAAEKYKVSIEIVDPENGFQPHKDAPNGGMINPAKNTNGKPMKIAYIRSKEKGKVGHFAPVIEVDGELKVVNITQDADTKDKCFAQAILFGEKYRTGKLKDIDTDSTHDFGTSKIEINDFYKSLAQIGRGNRSLRQSYNEGLTLNHSEFLGGDASGFHRRDSKSLGARAPRSRSRHPDSEGESDSKNPNIAYRALRKDEKPLIEGLRPPIDHDPNISAKDHVAHGSRATRKSAYVSASRSKKVAAAWASEGSGFVAEFDVPDQSNMPYEQRTVFDLTDPQDANYVFGNDTLHKNYAKGSQEVIIKDGVDASNISKLYKARVVSDKEYKELKKQNLEGMAFMRTRKKTSGSPLYRVLEKIWERSNDEN